MIVLQLLISKIGRENEMEKVGWKKNEEAEEEEEEKGGEMTENRKEK